MAGGPAVFLNPEPIADFIDLFLIGEAEEMLPEFLDVVSGGSPDSARVELLTTVVQRVAGAYVPSFYEPTYDGPRLVGLQTLGPRAGRIERRLVWDLNRFPTTTRVLSGDAVFGDMMLVEASRGCQWGCRFCAAGYMYRPIRTRGVAQLEEAVRSGLKERPTVGLVGAEMASVPGVDRLSEIAVEAGGRLSPSSLKADCVTPRLAAALVRGQNRSATIAPEAGYLLTVAFPSLTLEEANRILTETEGPGGGFLNDGSGFGVYSRLNLYAASRRAAELVRKKQAPN